MDSYRIMKDCSEPPIYWIEKVSGDEWVRVFGTTEFSADASWSALQNQEAIITPEEIQTIFQGERRDEMYRARDRIWSEYSRAEYRKQMGDV